MSWQSTMIPGFGPGGKPIITVIAKRSFEIAPGRVVLAYDQLPLYHSDISLDPSNLYYSEVISESDMISYKPCTDIVVLGKAYAPKGKKAYHLDCEVLVGPARKKMVVYGDRRVESKLMRGLSFTDPVPFEEQNIGFPNSFGGQATTKDGMQCFYPLNPLGKGFYLKGGFEEYSDLLVPNCEDPDSPIEPESLVLDKYEDWVKAPKPTSFAWTRPSFYPRYTFLGVVPEMLMSSGYQIDAKTPRLDLRFFQGASEGLCNHILNGNEHVKLTHMDSEYPTFEFELPGEKPSMLLIMGPESFSLDSSLHTVLIDKENGILSMVWRGCKEYEGSQIFEQGVNVGFEVVE